MRTVRRPEALPYSSLAHLRDDPRLSMLSRLQRSSPMVDAVIDEVRGRRIRVNEHWLSDFASCNYLGFDLDPEIAAAIDEQVGRWGTHPSWSRLLGNPRLYPEIEERLTELLGAPDTLVLPTITHIHASVLPVLAAGGTLMLEAHAHRTLYDGARIAAAAGATVHRFQLDDPDRLADLLRSAPGHAPRVVVADGVNSMTGNPPNLPLLARICREHGALLYIDDAHGFGVLGERDLEETSPYGRRGNAIVRYFDESYDDVVLVSGFSKAYSSLLAFLTAPTWLKEHLKLAAHPYLYSGPSPTASLATVLAGFTVNSRRGDVLRADVYRKTERLPRPSRHARRAHPERERPADRRDPPRRCRRPRRRRPAALGRRHLRHSRRVSPGPARLGRLPSAGHRGQHRRRGRRAARRDHGPCATVVSCARRATTGHCAPRAGRDESRIGTHDGAVRGESSRSVSSRRREQR